MIIHFCAASGFTTSLFLSRMATSFGSKDLWSIDRISLVLLAIAVSVHRSIALSVL